MSRLVRIAAGAFVLTLVVAALYRMARSKSKGIPKVPEQYADIAVPSEEVDTDAYRDALQQGASDVDAAFGGCETPPDATTGACPSGTTYDAETDCCYDCAFPPDASTGACADGFIPDLKGCCTQAMSRPPNVPLEITKTLATEVVLPIMGEVVARRMPRILKGGARLSANLAARMGVGAGARGAIATKFAAPKFARMLGNLVAKAAVKLGAKVAAIGAKMVAFASTGPVAIALVVFELFSMLVDIMDPSGYENFTSNAVNTNARMVAEVAMYTALKEVGVDYPMIFPVQVAFPDAFAQANQNVVAHLWGEAFEMLSEAENARIGDLMEAAVNALPESATEAEVDAAMDSVELPEDMLLTLENNVYAIMDNDPVRRDRMCYEEMRKLLPAERKDDIKLHTSYSKKLQVGITLTEQGVIHWNASKKPEWFQYNDIFEDVEIPDDYDPSYVAVLTDTYYLLDESNPGKKEHPNMIEKKLPAPVAIALPIGNVVAFCEKPRHKGIMGSDAKVGEAVDPGAFGVFFDSTKGKCRYTYPYCNRMGLEYKAGSDGMGDCHPYPGQDVAEASLGKTITRAFIRFGQAFEHAFGKFPTCAADELQRGLDCYHKPGPGRAVTTPGGFLHGVVCESGTNDTGTTCVYGRGVGRIPDKLPCPIGTRDDGTSCWLDSYGRGAGYSVKLHGRGVGRIPGKKPCPPGMRDDGTSCWADTKGCP